MNVGQKIYGRRVWSKMSARRTSRLSSTDSLPGMALVAGWGDFLLPYDKKRGLCPVFMGSQDPERCPAQGQPICCFYSLVLKIRTLVVRLFKNTLGQYRLVRPDEGLAWCHSELGSHSAAIAPSRVLRRNPAEGAVPVCSSIQKCRKQKDGTRECVIGLWSYSNDSLFDEADLAL
jgi:hypothetical protein